MINLVGHTFPITCLAVLPNGQMISGSMDRMIKVWDLVTGKCVADLVGHKKAITCLTVLPNGQVVSGSDDTMIKVWDLVTGKCVADLVGHKKAITCLTVLPNGQVVSGSADATLKMWNPITGRCTNLGREVDPSMRDLESLLENLSSHPGLPKLKNYHTDTINCLAVLPSGQVLSGSADKTIKVWDPLTGECLKDLVGHTNGITCLAVLPSGQVLSRSTDEKLKVWDPVTGQCVMDTDYVRSFAILPNGQVVGGSEDGMLRIWDPVTVRHVGNLVGHTGSVYDLAILPSGQVVSGSSRALRIWEPLTIGLSADEQPQLFEAVSHNTSLHTLDCSGFVLSETGIQSLAKVVSKHPTLRTLHLNYCGLNDENTTCLFEALAQKENGIQQVSLVGNTLSTARIDQLQKCLSQKQTPYLYPQKLTLSATNLAELHVHQSNNKALSCFQKTTLPSQIFTPGFVNFYQKVKGKENALPLYHSANNALKAYREARQSDAPPDSFGFHLNVMGNAINALAENPHLKASWIQCAAEYIETTVKETQGDFQQLLAAVPDLNNALTHAVRVIQKPVLGTVNALAELGQVLKQEHQGEFTAWVPFMTSLQETIQDVKHGFDAFAKIDSKTIADTAEALFSQLSQMNGEALKQHHTVNEMALACYEGTCSGLGSQQLLEKQQGFLQAVQVGEKLQAQFTGVVKTIGIGFECLSKLAGLSGHPQVQQLAREIATVGRIAVSISNMAVNALSSIVGGFTTGLAFGPVGSIIGGVAALGSWICSLFSSGPNPHEVTQDMIAELSKQVNQVRQEMHQRFDHVEKMLGTLHGQMHQRFDRIEMQMSHFYEGILGQFANMGHQLQGVGTAVNIIKVLSEEIQVGLKQISKEIDEVRLQQFSHDFDSSVFKLFKSSRLLEENDFLIICRYATDLAQNTFFAGESTLLWGSNEDEQQSLLALLKRKPIEYHINSFFSYAKKYLGFNSQLTSLVNPQIWSNGVLALVEFYYRKSDFQFEEKVYQTGLKDVIAAGEHFCQGVMELKVNDDVFRQLLNQYRKTLLSVIQYIDEHPESEPLKLFFMEQTAQQHWEALRGAFGEYCIEKGYITDNTPAIDLNLAVATTQMCLAPMSDTSAPARRHEMEKRLNASAWHLLHQSMPSEQNGQIDEPRMQIILKLQKVLGDEAQQKSVFRSLLQQLDLQYCLLTGFISLAFRKSYVEDQSLRILLNEKLWNSNSILGYLKNTLALQREFVHLVIEKNILKAVTDLETLLMRYIGTAQQAKKSNSLKSDYPLIEELMSELQLLETVVLPKPITEKAILSGVQMVASDALKEAVQQLLKKKYIFKIQRPSLQEIVITLESRVKILASNGSIQDCLGALFEKLETNLTNQGVANYTHEGDLESFKLKLSCTELNVMNQIGALLQDAGLNYWVQPITPSVFSCRPIKATAPEIEAAEIPGVECKIQ